MNRECPFVGHRLSLGAGRKEEEKTASRAQTLGGKYDVDIVGKKHIASKQIAFAVEIFFFGLRPSAISMKRKDLCWSSV